MDGLTLMAIRRELSEKLTGGRIEKITQPEKYELIFQIHSREGSLRLLFSAAAENGRVQLTKAARQNPLDAPPLLMLLRKRLTGGRILGFDQPNLDRVLHMRIQAADELGDPVIYTLTAEIMGRHSNVILWKEGTGVIVESLKHVTLLMSSVRQVLPGLPYEAPPAQQKLDPLIASESDFAAALAQQMKPERALVERFSGVSPKAARAICAALLPEACAPELMARPVYKLFQALARGEFSPTLIMDGAVPLEILPFDPMHVPATHKLAFESFQAALDAFYERRDERERMQKRTGALHKLLQNALERCRKKLAIQRDILLAEADRENLRLYGELITANLHSLKERQSEALLWNYYDDTQVLVPLDPTKPPSKNAQLYFKRYEKAKAACAVALVQVEKLSEERAYLEGQLGNVENCSTEAEAAEIRDELSALGYARPQKGARGKKRQKAAPSKPLHFISSDGLDVYVGKNNRQNDELTLRFADGDDLWLHTKDIAGSHVIVKASGQNAGVPEATLREAANLAAYYSRAKNSAQVPVDYALRKYVKKPAGALPGKVIYVNNKTLFVTPDERAALEMRRV